MQVTRDRAWTFRELVALDDKAFIAAAYLATLGRAAVAGEGFYLDQLRRGVSKTHILRDLMRSDEGRRFGSPIDGLRSAAAWDEARSLPLIGTVIGVLADVANLPGLTSTTRALQARVAQLENERSGATEEQLKNMERQFTQVAEILTECAANLMSLSSQTSQRFTELAAALGSMRESVEELKRHMAAREGRR